MAMPRFTIRPKASSGMLVSGGGVKAIVPEGGGALSSVVQD